MDFLFDKGKSHAQYPLKLVFIESQEVFEFPAQAMFVVPKRIFRRAADRNTLKRRMREAYRLNKENFYLKQNPAHKHFLLAFIYTSNKKEDYSVIEGSLVKLISAIR